MYMDNMIYYTDKLNMIAFGIANPTEIYWNIYNNRKFIFEEQIQNFLNKWYKNVFINGTHIVTIHRSEKNIETLTFAGWC